MHVIHPICEEKCKPFYGRPVCVVMHDGTRYFGTLSRLHNNELILNEAAPAGISHKSSLTAAPAKKSKNKKHTKAAGAAQAPATAKLSSFGPYPYGGYNGYAGYSPYGFGGGRVALGLASIALLFLLLI
ncbi:hypothetical protein [Paenibacillus sp. y28]|uniref:hypothetical protein n=1 Tax=Paenibacillus sp. y28 TaxID=3129110 RepID=UPI0030195B8B